jgi:hypothetical protein
MAAGFEAAAAVLVEAVVVEDEGVTALRSKGRLATICMICIDSGERG